MSFNLSLKCKSCGFEQYQIYRSKFTPVVFVHTSESGWAAHIANGYAKQGHTDLTAFSSLEKAEQLAKKWAEAYNVPYIPFNRPFLYIAEKRGENSDPIGYSIMQVDYDGARSAMNQVYTCYGLAFIAAKLFAAVKNLTLVEGYAIRNEEKLLIPHLCLKSIDN